MDEVIPLDKKIPKSVTAFQKRISNLEVDNLYCVHRSFHTAWLLRAMKAKRKIAYKTWWNGPFFNLRIQRPMGLPEPLRALALLAAVDSEWEKWFLSQALDYKNLPTQETVSFAATESKINSANLGFGETSNFSTQSDSHYKKKFQLNSPYIVVAPGSQWPTKRWTPSGFLEVCHAILQMNRNVYLVGGPDEKKYCDDLLSANSSNFSSSTLETSRPEIRSIAGETTLVELQQIIVGSELVISNDSGSMHMATYAGTPVISIFGPTTLSLGYRPWSQNSIVIQKKLSCRPCGSHGHIKCPIGTHECMKCITADEVILAAKDILQD